ncbi:hypothetical protein EGW08_007088 [Elysia chlorotica]|uniref:Uncharacterized protein n=1 Tax=Elysia chlorotica TaxID=188477 RepID=A0A3S1BJI9_ELYCH|nr:hypothetical protein EGW08_007088 [Elysia chlorotica]
MVFNLFTASPIMHLFAWEFFRIYDYLYKFSYISAIDRDIYEIFHTNVTDTTYFHAVLQKLVCVYKKLLLKITSTTASCSLEDDLDLDLEESSGDLDLDRSLAVENTQNGCSREITHETNNLIKAVESLRPYVKSRSSRTGVRQIE